MLAPVATFTVTATAPISVPLLAALFGGMSIDLLTPAWRLSVLIDSAEGVAQLLRHHAATLLVRGHGVADGMAMAGLLVFALSTMAGMHARLLAEPATALGAATIAVAIDLTLRTLDASMPGSLSRQATMGLILGNRNVRLV